MKLLTILFFCFLSIYKTNLILGTLENFKSRVANLSRFPAFLLILESCADFVDLAYFFNIKKNHNFK